MADNIGNKAAKDYHLDIPPVQEGFFVKGASHCDWGMKNRISRLFSPETGNTVMLGFDADHFACFVLDQFGCRRIGLDFDAQLVAFGL